MEEIVGRSYSPKGDKFLEGMAIIQKRTKLSKDLFTNFILNKKYACWHILDGWVICKNEVKGVEPCQEITLTWIASHTNSRGGNFPNIGDIVAIIDNFPDTDLDVKPFNIYTWKVESIDPVFNNKLTLSNYGMLLSQYYPDTGEYGMYKEPVNKLSLFTRRFLDRWKIR